jgi:hypothetical protein
MSSESKLRVALFIALAVASLFAFAAATDAAFAY